MRRPRNSKHDLLLRRLLAEVTNLIVKHGSRSEPLRLFVIKNREVPEFKSLASTLILLAEGVKACDNSSK